MEVSTSYDKVLLQHVEAKLDCLKTDEMTAPKDAHLALQAGQYVIIPEEEGNTLDIQKVDKALQEAVESGYTEVRSGCERLLCHTGGQSHRRQSEGAGCDYE